MGRSLTVLGVCKRDAKFYELLAEYTKLFGMLLPKERQPDSTNPDAQRYNLLRKYFYFENPDRLTDEAYVQLREEFVGEYEDEGDPPTCSLSCPPEGYFYCALGNGAGGEEYVGDSETPAVLIDLLSTPEGFPIPEKIIAYYM
jgi:hypothetical protein